MKTDPVMPSDLGRSVLAVPPLARAENGAISIAENRRIVDWLAAGGVSTFLYGGNANFYNLGILEYPLTLEILCDIAPRTSWMIPSIGPDFGKAYDQIAILRSFDFPTAMALPMANATRPDGVATGLRRLADAFGRPLIAYVRAENYIAPAAIAALLADGAVSALKYAVERKDPAEDRYLAAIVDHAGTERIVSGMGERPAIVHLDRFGLQGFTSGSVCIAPHLSTAILRAIKGNRLADAAALRAKFLPFEDQRDSRSPIVVLHAAVELAGIAKTGPVQPWLSDLEQSALPPVSAAAKALYEENLKFARRQAA